jgi:hypothetical protein
MPRRIVDVAPTPLERNPDTPPGVFTALGGTWEIRAITMVVDEPRHGVRAGDTLWMVFDHRGPHARRHGNGYPVTVKTLTAARRHIPRTLRFEQPRRPGGRAAA